MAIKIDLEKAYDRLEWDFIYRTLIRHNMDKNTCNLIMSFISSMSSTVLVNDQHTDPFREELGKVTPLSPYRIILMYGTCDLFAK